MKAFAALFRTLDESNKTSAKLAALRNYFASAAPEDAIWVAYFLMGRRPRRVVGARKLAEWASALAGIPDWLFGESYDAVGDIAETVTLLLPQPDAVSDLPLHDWISERLLPLEGKTESDQREIVESAWRQLDTESRFVWNKLITGGFRVGVSQQMVARALAEASGLERTEMAHRLMGNWEPTPETFATLVAPLSGSTDISKPYPFLLAHPISGEPQTLLGDIQSWQVEWKWDGIRSQLIKRSGQVFLWSRGEELVTDRYPEIAAAAELLPDGIVLDGELLPWDAEKGVQPFALLQQRIGRRQLSKKLLAEIPVVFLAYDVLEIKARDIRDNPLQKRRATLERVLRAVDRPQLRLSEVLQPSNWEDLTAERERSRERGVEGLMLKRRAASYGVGRIRGDWWKWKVDPYSIDAVLIYAQRGSGKRASLYTDYTLGVWDGAGANRKLVPFAKAYSGLTDAEIRQVDRFIRQNTSEKFGPVRTVKPELVFEIGFEGIQRSNRHKSGIAVRFPRILRWRQDKLADQADTLAALQALLPL